MKKRFTALFLVIISIFCCFFTACNKSDEELIEARVEEFVEAYNDGDMDALLECMDRKSRKQLQATMNLLGALTGALLGVDINLSDLFSLGIAMTDEDWLTVTISNISIDGDEAIVNAQMSLNNGYFVEEDNVTFFMVKEDDDWYVQDLKDYYVAPPAPDSSNSGANSGQDGGSDSNDSSGEETAKSNYILVMGAHFVDERAWVAYQDLQTFQEYSGWIDTQGNVLYSADRSYYYSYDQCYNIGKGAGIIRTNTELQLIGADGSVKTTIDGKVDILGYGGGYALLYQDKSTMTTLQHMYGIINQDGEWEVPFTNLEEKGAFKNVEYVGEGIFSYRTSAYKEFINVEQGYVMQARFLDYIRDNRYSIESLNVECIENGIIYTHDERVEIDKYNFAGEQVGTRIDVAGPCLIFPDGRVEQVGIGEFIDGKLIERVDGYLKITDYTKETPITTIFDKYPEEMIEEILFVGDYGLLEIRGVDGERYVTMIDTQGNERIEPIKGKRLSWVQLAEGGYLYVEGDNETYCIDKDGNQVTLDIEYRYLQFEGDIGKVSTGYYIKANGEKLFDTLTIK